MVCHQKRKAFFTSLSLQVFGSELPHSFLLWRRWITAIQQALQPLLWTKTVPLPVRDFTRSLWSSGFLSARSSQVCSIVASVSTAAGTAAAGANRGLFAKPSWHCRINIWLWGHAGHYSGGEQDLKPGCASVQCTQKNDIKQTSC